MDFQKSYQILQSYLHAFFHSANEGTGRLVDDDDDGISAACLLMTGLMVTVQLGRFQTTNWT